MKLKTIVSIMCASVMFSCTDLDMSPVNVVNEEDLFANEAGTLSYISGMYMNLPLEDFRYATKVIHPLIMRGRFMLSLHVVQARLLAEMLPVMNTRLWGIGIRLILI
ncbi:MAG: hypothetical protein ACLUE2_19195 [Bacteroides cellulosilyticus]